MNIRLPIIAAVVTVAAGAAALRAAHLGTPASTLSVDASPEVAATGASRHAPSRDRATPIVVYVAGAVRHRGIYRLPPSARIYDALDAAGGPTASADLVTVNLAQALADGDEVAVPALGADPAPVPRAHAHRRGAHHRAHHKKRHRKRPAGASEVVGEVDTADGSAASDAPPSVVELNSADEAELETLPGIGPALAERIVAFRDQTGPYGSPDDLLDVAGMTPAKLDAIAPYISVS
jgi:competence protein ComEA